jgi:hypothetical protein
MKTTTNLVAILVMLFSTITMAVASTDSNYGPVSVLASSAVIQDEAVPPTPVEPVVPVEAAVQTPVAPVAPVAQEPVAPVPAEMVIEAPSIMMDSAMMAAPVAGNCCPTTCCPTPCQCCPPTPTDFCLQDPCGCSHQACVQVPACCAGEQPCITWKKGLFGRQTASLCWKCCGHEVKVLVRRNGSVKVRG